MRVSTFAAAFYISLLADGSTAGHNILSALAPHTPVLRAAAPTSPPLHSGLQDRLELRQAPGLAPVAAPAADIVAPAVPGAAPPVPVDPPAAVPPAIVPPAIGPAFVPAPAPAAAIPPPVVNPVGSPAPPAAVVVSPLTTSTLPSPPLKTSEDLVTVQWVETHIGKLRTWIPKTYTFHFEAMSQAPLPSVGSIGMGTLTGKTGQTQTIYMVVAEAPTAAVDARKAVVAAMAAALPGSWCEESSFAD
ncbi:hypothetical protein SVAN01_04378 [Stagonosporopsis vannaccii]|nr:hypothetical protein SVAN01_04378 [Stagonosporopsis vannaccii]